MAILNRNDKIKSVAILTSGGDAPGMNAAVRSVVRTALDAGLTAYAIKEGYQGMVDGGDFIVPMGWQAGGGILQQGGTVIGTARCKQFRTRAGRLQAACNLVRRDIDSLVVIGGDGSLTGANLFRAEWPGLLAELREQGRLTQEAVDRHPWLTITGLVGSIDNDMAGTDMTIGADTALHRLTEAVDAISSTAASHQRAFVVEVMGRHCGYLALMGALATGADWVLIPESPPDVENWEDTMCNLLRAGRAAGRRDSIVIVAEGATDRAGKPISSAYVKAAIEQRLQEDVRVTVLGHMQRGGSPSAFDRTMSSQLGYAAVQEILSASAESESYLIGVKNNRITHSPLMDCVAQTKAVGRAMAAKDFAKAVELRGQSFSHSFRIFRTLARALPHKIPPGRRRLRLAIIHAGGPAPGMNTAVRVAARLSVDKGHLVWGIRNGFQGFAAGQIEELGWMSVAGWATRGGAELGTNRKVPRGSDLYAIARNIEKHQIDGLLIIGGWAGYQAAYRMYSERGNFPAFNMPIVCLPASINNNLPGSDLSIGADTALNSIVQAVDKIKQSAVASRRVFVVEVMGRHCGYLALMSGFATGAERVYMHEEGITLKDMQQDLDDLMTGFRRGKRLGLIIRGERANDIYDTNFICKLFEEEGGDLFEVRQAILGHLQQGGDPSPFDRIQATRLAAECIDLLLREAENPTPNASFIGLEEGQVKFHDLQDMPRMVDEEFQRPRKQWWMDLRPVARILAQPAPTSTC